MGFQILC